jgi:hypothetical protein
MLKRAPRRATRPGSAADEVRWLKDGPATQWLTRLETNTYDEVVAVRYASAS